MTKQITKKTKVVKRKTAARKTAARKTAQQPQAPLPQAAPRMVVETNLTMLYETKNAEYVFGDELSDGFVSVTLPKDRFVDKPTTLRIKIDLIA